jgi:DNA-binding CsgD family transcriptional regulator
MNARMRAVPFVARTHLAYARVLLARGSFDDRRRAADLLAQAEETATKLGMIRLSEEATVLREPLTAGPTPAGIDAPAPFGLSEREREVLRLLAEGRSNPEIAETLFISRATARTHVGNVLAKLGVHSRAEAVDAAHRFGLLDRPRRAAT